MDTHHRSFIRHPIEIPIEVAAQDEAVHLEPLKNLSFGGLAFGTQQRYAPGTLLGINISTPGQPVQLTARVAWCKRCPQPDGEAAVHPYEIGVAFEDDLDAFRIRMVEQICQIERYRLSVLGAEGRELTSEEAALEWIERYGACFYPRG